MNSNEQAEHEQPVFLFIKKFILLKKSFKKRQDPHPRNQNFNYLAAKTLLTMTSIVEYLGELRTKATHLQSKQLIITDAPTDNHGKGEAFSPTDLVATALGNCMLTVMGIKARDMNIDLKGASISITKIMGTEPRRIVEIRAAFSFKKQPLNEKEKAILENTARTCPVFYSLHPELKKTISFEWS